MQSQISVKLTFSQKPKPTPQQIRNRRYKKLLQLRQSGFFSQDSIKLRHPLLYHTYLGQNSQKGKAQQKVNCTLSQFLQKNLINLEYRQKLAQELDKKMNMQDDKSQQWQVLEQASGQVNLSKDGIRDTGITHSWDIVEEQQIELEQQNLIDHAEQLFLEGRVDSAYIDYSQIDNCSDYDVEFQNRNRQENQQRYFNQQCNSQQDQEINRVYYTGVQDY